MVQDGIDGCIRFMLVNGRQAWNMLRRYHDDRFVLTNVLFCLALAEELLAFCDESAVNFVSEERLSHSVMMIQSGHEMAPTPRGGGRIHCCVCNLKKQFRMSANRNAQASEKWKYSYSFKNIAGCNRMGATCMPILSEIMSLIDSFFKCPCFRI